MLDAALQVTKQKVVGVVTAGKVMLLQQNQVTMKESPKTPFNKTEGPNTI